MHHKYMVIDQAAPTSDPIAFTGSHNWSAAADNDNDENTLVIHDATIANIYYQNFVKRFVDNNGVLNELTGPPVAVVDSVYTPMDQLITVQVLENDTIQSAIDLTIETTAQNGNAYIPFTNPNVISYQPNPGFFGYDVITYKIAYQASASLNASADIIIKVGTIGLNENEEANRLLVYPNPIVNGSVTISFALLSSEEANIQLVDLTGRVISERAVKLNNGENIIQSNYSETLKGCLFYSCKYNNQDLESKSDV